MSSQPIRTARLTLVEVQDCEHIRWFAGRIQVGESLACEKCRDNRTVTQAVPQAVAVRDQAN